MPRRFVALAIACAAVVGLAPIAARAHGGLSMDQDRCKLTVGRYLMHFAGYQEDAQRTEFCEDIPHKGRTIVALDFVDDALRELPVEVRIVRRPAADQPAEAGETVFTLAPRVYPRGTLTFSHDFHDDGDYVGLVWAGPNRNYKAEFPFSVGRDDTAAWLGGGAAVLLMLGVGGYFAARHRLRRAVAGSGTQEASA